ncbi:MAG TPA: hypothetical protein ACFYD5_06290, partial [Candidatus Tripitaka sp. YC43]
TLGGFKAHASGSPAPKDLVSPATIYPPSRVCWIELACSLSPPPYAAAHPPEAYKKGLALIRIDAKNRR